MKSFEQFLEEQFIERLEYNGIPIIKDNCDDLFGGWLEECDKQEIIDLAEKWCKEMKEEILNDVNKIGEILK